MNRFIIFSLTLVICIQGACRPRAKSDKSYDQICKLVAGKTEAEVARLLGQPDRLDKLPYGEERWTWWNYTYLAGQSWAPEVRDKIVHLEITFVGPIVAPVGIQERSTWRVSEPYGVGYVIPDNSESPPPSLNKNLRGRV